MKSFIAPPNSYKEMRLKAEASANSTPKPGIAEETPPPDPAHASVKEKPAAKSASEPAISPSPEPETKAKVKCFFRIPRPETPSRSAKYTRMIEHYGEDAAMKLLLRAAMDEWIEGYTPTTPIDQAPRYAKSRDTYGTTKYLDGALFKQVQSRIDPMDFRPAGYIARMIALTAIAAYLERH